MALRLCQIWAGVPNSTRSFLKAQRSHNLLHRNVYVCLTHTKEMAYKALVHPVLEYASSTWYVYQSNHMQGLEGVQRTMAWFDTNKY